MGKLFGVSCALYTEYPAINLTSVDNRPLDIFPVCFVGTTCWISTPELFMDINSIWIVFVVVNGLRLIHSVDLHCVITNIHSVDLHCVITNIHSVDLHCVITNIHSVDLHCVITNIHSVDLHCVITNIHKLLTYIMACYSEVIVKCYIK